jgi:hypothetical protein|tara:strand:- start:6451 stop:6765 length:315 start_codon:yes stop_codon:yes gene_type:complete
MYPTPNKYDKIYTKSRNPYKKHVPAEKYIDEKYNQLRLYFKCESSFFNRIMKVNLWYSEHSKEWRWTLMCDQDPKLQESGGQNNLRKAMEDIANTVEYIMDANK